MIKLKPTFFLELYKNNDVRRDNQDYIEKKVVLSNEFFALLYFIIIMKRQQKHMVNINI